MKKASIIGLVSGFAALGMVLLPASALAGSYATDFEPSTFTLGNINGQNGWSKTGSYDSEVATNNSGFSSFGTQSLRISNAVASGAFGDQTFAPLLTDGAGESTVASSTNHFEAQFDIAMASTTPQPGLFISVSPDNGSGARMSYLGFGYEAGGTRVTFYDVADAGPLGTVASFNPTDLGLLSTTSPHTIKFVMDFVDGPGNDVVKIYIDNALVHTGTSWEDYYRFDPEQNGNGNQLSQVKTLLFRAGGSSVPSTLGGGFLFDNVSITSSNVTSGGNGGNPGDKDECKEGGWAHMEDHTFKNQGDCVSFMNHHDGKGNDDEHAQSGHDNGHGNDEHENHGNSQGKGNGHH